MNTMKAVVIEEFGGPEALRYRDVPRPTPAKDEVLVRVRACGVCHLDLILRSGTAGPTSTSATISSKSRLSPKTTASATPSDPSPARKSSSACSPKTIVAQPPRLPKSLGSRQRRKRADENQSKNQEPAICSKWALPFLRFRLASRPPLLG